MESHFEVAGSCATSRDGYEAIPSLESNRPKQVWKFVDEFQQLLGDESAPDSQFFVESWTFGMNAAVDNYQQRRKKKAIRDRQSNSFEAFEDLVNLSMNEGSEDFTEYPYPVETATYTGSPETGWRLRSSEERGSQSQELQPQDLDAHEFDPLDEVFGSSPASSYPMTPTGLIAAVKRCASVRTQKWRRLMRLTGCFPLLLLRNCFNRFETGGAK